jgi:hypothetical protein
VAYWADFGDDCTYSYLGTVQVTTHDNWTTSPEVTLEGGGDKLYGTIALTERNLAGLGLALSAMHREDPVGTSRYLSVADASIAGSHWLAQFVAGSGDAGGELGTGLTLPGAAIAENSLPRPALPFAGLVALHGPLDPAPPASSTTRPGAQHHPRADRSAT